MTKRVKIKIIGFILAMSFCVYTLPGVIIAATDIGTDMPVPEYSEDIDAISPSEKIEAAEEQDAPALPSDENVFTEEQDETDLPSDENENDAAEAVDDTDDTIDPANGDDIALIAKAIVLPEAGTTYDISEAEEDLTISSSGEYTITGSTNQYKIIVESGDPTIILKDVTIDLSRSDDCPFEIVSGSCNLKIEGKNTLKSKNNGSEPGIKVESGKSLTIDGTGSLYANGGYYGAGIGGGYDGDAGEITIIGGYVEAISSFYGAGIGGGYGGNGGKITIKGGTVKAVTENDYGAGIGGGVNGNCGEITISGGNVEANGEREHCVGIGGYGTGGTITISGSTTVVKASGGTYGAGIGSYSISISKYGDNGAEIIIEGGNITATGGSYGAGIGGGNDGSGGTITISGSTTVVNASGGGKGAGIGGGNDGNGGTITIKGGDITARGGNSNRGAAGIGGGYNSSGGTITIEGGDVKAYGGNGEYGQYGGAGIGGGCDGSGGTINIYGGTISATGISYSAGIGGGYHGGGGKITMSGGNITAKGGDNGPGIGNGSGGSNGTVAISGNTVITLAQGGANSAGIGGGYSSGGGTIMIESGDITANGGSNGAGIGGGVNGAGGTITIKGGDITANGGSNGAGIGGGYHAGGGNITITNGTITVSEGSYSGRGVPPQKIGYGAEYADIVSGTIPSVSEAAVVNGGIYYTTVLEASASSQFSYEDKITISVIAIPDARLGAAEIAAYYNGDVIASVPLDESSREYSLEIDTRDLGIITNGTVTVTYITDSDGNEEANKSVNLPINISKKQLTTDMFEFKTPDDLIYNGGEKAASVTVKDGHTEIGAITVKYYYADNGSLVDGIPVNEGSYIVKIDVEESECYTGAQDLYDYYNWRFSIVNEYGKIDISKGSVEIYSDGYSFSGGSKISYNGSYIITQFDETTYNNIVISGDNVNVTIKGLNIFSWCPIEIVSGSCNFTIEGENTLTSYSEAGIMVNSDCSLTIDGTGSLTANCEDFGSGIGGRDYDGSSTIKITGGSVTANGGNYGAGIGGSGYCGTIIISGGTVTAMGGNDGPGIGGCNSYMSGGTIIISGGTVTAEGGTNGAGIGGGYECSGGNITITGGKITAKAGNYDNWRDLDIPPEAIGHGADYDGIEKEPEITGGIINGVNCYSERDITVNNSIGGTVTADNQKAYCYDIITLTADPGTGYELDKITVTTASGNDVTVENNSFIMPDEDVTVTAAWKKIDYVKLDKSVLFLDLNESETLTVSVSPENSQNQMFTWSSSAPDVISISGNGKTVTITALKEGTAVVTVSLNGITASCTVTVGSKIISDGETEQVGDGIEMEFPKGGTKSSDGTITADEVVTDGTTVKGDDVKVDPEGNITVSKGGTVQNGNDPEMQLPQGGTRTPDGTVTADEIVTDGTTVKGDDVKVDPEGNITVPKGGTVQNGDDPEMQLPQGGTRTPDGTVTADEIVTGGTTVKGDDVKVDPEGNITLPNGGTVKTDDNEKIVPNGTVIDKNGNINSTATVESAENSGHMSFSDENKVKYSDKIALHVENTEMALTDAERKAFESKHSVRIAAIYDITLRYNGNTEVQPDEFIKVTIALPEGVDGKIAKIFRREADHSFTDMNAEYDRNTNTLSFVTNHLSIYVIAETVSNGSGSSGESERVPPLSGRPDYSSSSESDNSGTDNSALTEDIASAAAAYADNEFIGTVSRSTSYANIVNVIPVIAVLVFMMKRKYS